MILALTAHGDVGVMLFAIACACYGTYVLYTRGSYWVSDLIYLVPVLALLALMVRL